MSSRQEQKEKRRQERIAAEKAEQARKERQQRMYWIGGGVIGVIAIVAIVVAIASGGGDSKTTDSETGEGITASAPVSGPTIPAATETNLQTAAKAAGCTLKTFQSEGREHDDNPASWKYKANPPTSGTHNPTWAEDGVYPFGKAPPVGFTTHALEHGRINIQYGPKLTRAQFDQLQTLMAEDQGYHQLLYKNQTQMPGTLAATAWTQQMVCTSFSPKVFDALRNFKARYVDQGPEAVP